MTKGGKMTGYGRIYYVGAVERFFHCVYDAMMYFVCMSVITIVEILLYM